MVTVTSPKGRFLSATTEPGLTCSTWRSSSAFSSACTGTINSRHGHRSGECSPHYSSPRRTHLGEGKVDAGATFYFTLPKKKEIEPRPTPGRGRPRNPQGGDACATTKNTKKITHHTSRITIMTSLKRILLLKTAKKDVELTLMPWTVQPRQRSHHCPGTARKPWITFIDAANLPTVRKSSAVVLLDLKMPKVDGLEVLRQMKADPNFKKVPVVMLTSSREEQDLVEATSWA